MTYGRTDHSVEEVRREDGTVVHEERVTTEPAHVYTEAEASDRVGTTSMYESLPTRVNGILFALLLALEGLLALRFALVAFGANQASGFVEFVMDVSYPFVKPFENAFTNRTWDEGIIEVNTLLAMGVYFLAFLLIGVVLNAIIPNVTASETRVSRSRVTHQ